MTPGPNMLFLKLDAPENTFKFRLLMIAPILTKIFYRVLSWWLATATPLPPGQKVFSRRAMLPTYVGVVGNQDCKVLP